MGLLALEQTNSREAKTASRASRGGRGGRGEGRRVYARRMGDRGTPLSSGERRGGRDGEVATRELESTDKRPLALSVGRQHLAWHARNWHILGRDAWNSHFGAEYIPYLV